MSSPAWNSGTAHLLWNDTHVFTARHEKAARALVNIVSTLAKERPLSGGETEFLELFGALTTAEPAAFTAVWRQPYAYYWARTTHEMIEFHRGRAPNSIVARRYLAATDVATSADALRQLLEAFKAFPLAVACLTGKPLRFSHPWTPCLPVAVPANSWSLSGKVPVAILGADAEGLVVAGNGAEHRLSLNQQGLCDSGGFKLEICPVARQGDYQLLLQPALFHQPDLVYETRPILEAGVDYQWQHRGLIEQTLQVLATFMPDVLAQFRAAMQVIALKPEGRGDTRNTSYTRLPGAFTFSNNANPFTLAEDFIHEFHHNRLFAIEELGPFFDNSTVDAIEDARFYSPWRRDPRPLYGIWHAIYVFTPVVRYWLRVYESGDIAQQHRDYAADRLVRLPAMLHLAARELERYATWTEFGRSLFDLVRVEHGRLERHIAAAGVPADGAAWDTDHNGGYTRQIDDGGRPITALQAVERHARNFRPDGFTADLVASTSQAA